MLRKNPSETILYDVRASRAVADIVQAGGGPALINRVGHAFFKARMREEGGSSAARSPAITTSGTSTAPIPARFRHC